MQAVDLEQHVQRHAVALGELPGRVALADLDGGAALPGPAAEGGAGDAVRAGPIDPVVSCDTAIGAARTGAALATWPPRGGRAEAVTGGVRPVPIGWLVWATFLGFWIDPVAKGLPKASPKRLESAEHPLMSAATAVMAQI